MKFAKVSGGESSPPLTQQHKHLGGAKSDILLAAAVSILPMLGLAAALLGIVYANIVHPISRTSASLIENGLPTPVLMNDSGVYYIAFSATRFTTVASWASTLTTFLPGVFMNLLWYHLASSIGQRSQAGDIAELPTSFQFNLFLAMRSGGLPPLWDWIRYSLSRHRRNQSPVLSTTGRVLLITVILGWLVWAADTWLHVTTTAVNIDQVSKSPSVFNYGRELPYHCGLFGGHNCTINLTPEYEANLVEPLEFYLTLSNQSTQNQVLVINVGDQRFSYIADAQQINDVDFIATTIASQSDCSLVTDKCHWIGNNTIYDRFSCSALFNSNTTSMTNDTIGEGYQNGYLVSGASDSNTLTLGYFTTPDWTIPLNKTSIPNPFYTIAMVGIGAASSNTGGSGLESEEELVLGPVGGPASDVFFFGCETRLFNFTYTSVGGSVVSVNTTVIANPNLLSALFATQQNGLCTVQITNSAFLAWFKSGSAITDTFADQYNACFLAPAASVAKAIPNIVQQVRSTALVTRVQKAAFFGLTATLLLSALFGFGMTLLAMSSRPATWRDIQARLSIIGLTSARFESSAVVAEPVGELGKLYGENNGDEKRNHIGMLRSDTGGWKYVSWIGDAKDIQTDIQGDGIPLLDLPLLDLDLRAFQDEYNLDGVERSEDGEYVQGHGTMEERSESGNIVQDVHSVENQLE